MAWFNETDAADKPTPVTPERFAAALSRQELTFSRDDDGSARFYCIINDLPVSFDATGENTIVINVGIFERLDAAQANEVLNWVTAYNAATHFTSATQNVDDQGTFIFADTPIYTAAGLTDKQLDDQLELALSASLRTLQHYCTDFEITPNAE